MEVGPRACPFTVSRAVKYRNMEVVIQKPRLSDTRRLPVPSRITYGYRDGASPLDTDINVVASMLRFLVGLMNIANIRSSLI